MWADPRRWCGHSFLDLCAHRLRVDVLDAVPGQGWKGSGDGYRRARARARAKADAEADAEAEATDPPKPDLTRPHGGRGVPEGRVRLLYAAAAIGEEERHKEAWGGGEGSGWGGWVGEGGGCGERVEGVHEGGTSAARGKACGRGWRGLHLGSARAGAHVRATLPAQGGEALSAERFGCGLKEAWTPGSGGGECKCMPFVLVLVKVEQREWGGFTYASKDAREHDDRLLLTRCPEIRHHRRVETRGDLRRHFETARPGLSTPPRFSTKLSVSPGRKARARGGAVCANRPQKRCANCRIYCQIGTNARCVLKQDEERDRARDRADTLRAWLCL